MKELPGVVVWGVLAAICGASACVSSSIKSDVARVRELTEVSELPRVEEHEVQKETSGEVRRLLAEPLDADGAVRIAVLSNHELRATLRELGIARARLVQAGLPPNPLVEAELLPERDTELELRVEYDIMGALLASRRLHAEEPMLQAARYHAAAAVVDLGYRVRVAFYRLQAVEQGHALAQHSVEALGAAAEAARALGKAGTLPELDTARQVVAHERARARAAEIELDVVTEREALQRLLGIRDSAIPWRVRQPLAPAPETARIPEDAEGVALRKSLELSETRQRLESLARRTGLARVEGWLPDVTADVHALLGDPDSGASADENWRFGAGVSVGVPLFDHGQGTTAELQAEFHSLLERYYGMAIDIRSAVREAKSRLSSAHARARQYQQVILPAQARVTEQTLLQYNAMQLGVFELLQARREELDTQLAHNETLREYWSAVAALDALLAGKRTSAPASTATPGSLDAGAQGGH